MLEVIHAINPEIIFPTGATRPFASLSRREQEWILGRIPRDPRFRIVVAGKPDIEDTIRKALFAQHAMVHKAKKDAQSLDDFSKFVCKYAPELLAVSSDLGSIVRNSYSAVSAVNAQASLATGLGFFGGAAALPIGGLLAARGIVQAKESRAIDDREGEVFGTLNATGGISYALLGLGMIFSKAALVHGVEALGAAGTGLMDPFGIAMYLAFLVHGSYSMRIASSFRSELSKSMEQGLEGGLSFLRRAVGLTEEEMVRVSKIEDLDIRKREIEHLLQRKGAAFARRTDEETLHAVRSALSEGRIDANTVQSLLERISKANYTRIIKATILILIALAGLAAMITSIVMSGGAPFILFALGAVMWIFVDKSGLADKVADLLWKIHVQLFGKITDPIDADPFVAAMRQQLRPISGSGCLTIPPLTERRKIFVDGEEMWVSQQTAIDRESTCPTAVVVGDEKALFDDSKDQILKKLKIWAAQDEELFHALSFMNTQAPGNYIAECFTLHSQRLRIFQDGKPPQIINAVRSIFRRKDDGSIECEYHFNVMRIMQQNMPPYTCKATFGLSKVSGQWTWVPKIS